MKLDPEALKNFAKHAQRAAKNFDWRSLQKYTSPKASADINAFLEKLPQNAGKTMLIIAGVTWGVAAAVGLFTTVQIQKLTDLRKEYEEAQALKPAVPEIRDVPVQAAEITSFVQKAKEIYKDLEISGSGATIAITSNTTGSFGQFREAIGHVQNGGLGWRVAIDKLCVGRECSRYPISVVLKINKVSVN